MNYGLRSPIQGRSTPATGRRLAFVSTLRCDKMAGMGELEDRLKEHAQTLGFDLVGVAPASPADGFDRLRDWLARGFAGTMDYMQRHGEARRHPSSILP